MAMESSTAPSTRWWMTGLQAVAAMLGLALVAAIVFEIQDAREAGVTQLEIEGAFQKVDPVALRDTMTPWLAGGAVLQMEEIKARLEQQPWIAQARVERSWPGLVRVRIWEYTAVARWNDSLLSTEGAVFQVPEDTIAVGLPRLTGPNGREAEVRAAYEQMTAALGSAELAPVALSLNDRGDWVAQTAAGAELRFNRGDLAEQLEFLQGPVSQALAGKWTEVEYVDLHYSNGFAAAMKPAPKAASGGKR
jgi:cell division protein FtsQ